MAPMLGTFPNWLQILTRTLQAQGRDLPAALRAAGVELPDGAGDDDTQARLPVSLTRPIWEAADALSGDPVLGLSMLRHVDFTDFGELGVVLAAGGSLSDMMERVQRFHRLLTDALDYRIDKQGDTLIVAIQRSSSVHWRADEFAAGLVTALLRHRLKPPVQPTRVQLAFDNPAGRTAYERYFGCPIEMNAAETTLRFPLVETGSTGAGARLAQAFEPILENQLAQLSDNRSWSRQVGTLLAGHLARERGATEFALEDAAQALHLSARTLQRHLAKEGKSFRDVADDVRRDLVEKWLSRRGDLAHMRSITELALQLGFSSSSAFNRAFKRWFGMAPIDALRKQEEAARPPHKRA